MHSKQHLCAVKTSVLFYGFISRVEMITSCIRSWRCNAKQQMRLTLVSQEANVDQSMNIELAPGHVMLTLVVCATAGPTIELTSGLVCQTERSRCQYATSGISRKVCSKVLPGSSKQHALPHQCKLANASEAATLSKQARRLLTDLKQGFDALYGADVCMVTVLKIFVDSTPKRPFYYVTTPSI